MKKWCVLTLILMLAFSVAACGCQKSEDPNNTTTAPSTANGTETTPAPTITEPIVDPTILDPTFETNIPDSTVNDNSTRGTDDAMP